jgi:hypothetical protein
MKLWLQKEGHFLASEEELEEVKELRRKEEAEHPLLLDLQFRTSMPHSG